MFAKRLQGVCEDGAEGVAEDDSDELGEDKDGPILLGDDGEAAKNITLGKHNINVVEKEKESPLLKAYNTALSNIVSKYKNPSMKTNI
jgi:hypothetical protein